MTLQVSVIICCFTEQRLKDTQEAIESVLVQSKPPDEVILAVDSNRPLFEQMRQEVGGSVKVVLNETRGISANRNTGIAAATGDLVVFLDDDAVAQKDWLEYIVRPFEDPRIVAVGGEILPLWHHQFPPLWWPEEFDFVFGCTVHKKLVMQENGEVRNVSGASMCFRKDAIEAAGFFDSEISRKDGKWMGQSLDSGEEADLCLRIKAKVPGCLIIHESKSVALHKIHPGRTTLKYVFSFCFQEGLNRAKIEAKLAGLVDNALGTERLFFRRIVFRSIPRRLLGFYKPKNLAQLGVILGNLMLIGAGYVIGKFRYRNLARS